MFPARTRRICANCKKSDNLEELLKRSANAKPELNLASRKRLPLLVKIAPDLSEAEIEAIVGRLPEVRILAGIIATNTTVIERKSENFRLRIERIGSGGLSGKPLSERSTEVFPKFINIQKGNCRLSASAGFLTPRDAFEKIAAGACLIQAYTGFVYRALLLPATLISGSQKFCARKVLLRSTKRLGRKLKVQSSKFKVQG